MSDRNTEMQFSKIPSVNIQRSKFHRNATHTFTMNAADLIPFYADEILPGDTVEMKGSEVIRMTTPIVPVFGNAFMDIYWYFVPRRLTWDHWEEFMGENKSTYWTNPTVYTIPQIKTGAETYWRKGDIAQYMGMARIKTVNHPGVDANYFRGYAKIWNEWFRDENLEEPANVSNDISTDVTITNMTTQLDDPIVGAEYGGVPLKVCKVADYFTSALPNSQKGPDVYLPLGSTAPIITGEINENLNYPATMGLHFANANTGEVSWNTYRSINTYGSSSTEAGEAFTDSATSTITGLGPRIIPDNLYADLSKAQAATINAMRTAFAIQRMLEKDARGGTRYRELIKSHFSVITDDARMQVPEYLGGKRIPITMQDVIQQSSTDDTSPQGHVAGMSKTIDSDYMFKKSFTEHGMLFGLCCIRTEHTYAQGINRRFTRRNREDFFFPSLANLGETYIKNKELFVTGTDTDEEAFGYQERWAEYRYEPNRVSGEFSPDYDTPLDMYTYADEYTETPTLGKTWIEETKANIDRSLAIQNQDQFMCDFYVEGLWTRPMPMYSVPGLLDHH